MNRLYSAFRSRFHKVRGQNRRVSGVRTNLAQTAPEALATRQYIALLKLGRLVRVGS